MKKQLPPIIYLACPYTDRDRSVRRRRYRQATKAAALLIQKGFIVYSPITMTHPIDELMAQKEETMGSDYWVAFDEAFMEVCSKIIVLRLVGWDSSKGVQREIEFFKSKGRPIEYLDWEIVANSR